MDINEIMFLGVNKYGQAGIGQKYHNKSFTVPKSFVFPTFIKQISCGSHHSALLTIDGNIYTMGSNIHGALGSNPSLNYSFVPTLVEGLNEVTKIDCGPFHMCAISNGELYSWGKGIDGQLGHGNTKNVSKPLKVQGLDKYVQQVSCGTNHTLVLLNSGKEDGSKIGYAFGNGIYGQLGSGQGKNSYLPIKIKLDNIESIAAGQNHSLFLSGGNLYSCGDNSNGQLGTLFNKKFIAEPTFVEINSQNQCNIKLIQAKKYSLALTDTGDIYIWGLKNSFGSPKIIKSEEKCQLEVIDIRVGTEQVYGLAAQGTLYSWGIKNYDLKSNALICKKQKIVSNGRAVLDFSAGDNYLLILGDIVKQIPYSTAVPLTLTYYEELDKLPQSNRKQANISSQRSNIGRDSVESRLVQESKQSKSIVNESKFSEIDLSDSQTDYQFLQKSSLDHEYMKSKLSYDIVHAKSTDENGKTGLFQRKDFNNLKTQHSKSTNEGPKNTERHHKTTQQYSQNENDHYDLVKTPSSSILCEPTNFLKESTRKQNYEIRKAAIFQSEFDHSSVENELFMAKNQNWKKKKYSYSYLQQKENIGNQKNQKQSKRQKKFDKIIAMIEKSNQIGTKDPKAARNPSDQQWQNDSEIVKSNKLLRIQLRDRQLKISQLQQILSRKQMEIEAQRELIRALRDKNNSNYNSEQ